MDELSFARNKKHLDCIDWLDWEHKEVMAMVLFSMALFLEKKLKLLCKLQQNEPTIIGMYLNPTLRVKSDLYVLLSFCML